MSQERATKQDARLPGSLLHLWLFQPGTAQAPFCWFRPENEEKSHQAGGNNEKKVKLVGR